MGMAPDPTTYDEQIGMTFTQSFTSMTYNVTAVEQTDPSSGVGPAYLLNGLSDSGYWYQVGLSYNWEGPSRNPGFNLLYEVWDSARNSIYPTNGGGGVQAFSGNVRAGDTVLLNLYFSSAYGVVMLAVDSNTGATSSKTYSAEGGSEFIGLSSGPGNSNGYFTGLMTEWYHSSPFYGNISPVKYTNSHSTLTSAWMWIDEFSCSDVSCSSPAVLFSDASSAPVYYSGQTSLHEFSSHGATEFSNAYGLITGPAYLSVTVSYSVIGGGTGFGEPSFSYSYQDAVQSATLTQLPKTYTVDAVSSWSVSDSLPGSSQDERWVTSSTAGTASSSQTINFAYQHQYLLSVFGGVISSMTAPQIHGATGWYDAGSGVSIEYEHAWDIAAQRSRVVATGFSVNGHFDTVPVSGNGTFSVDLEMNSPMAVVIKSSTQYYIRFVVANASGLEALIPTQVEIRTGNQSEAVVGLGIWLDNGSTFTVPMVTYEGVDVAPAPGAQYVVTAPGNITLNALVYDAALRATDFLGLPVGGAQVEMTLVNGTVLTGTTNAKGVFMVSDIPLGNFTGKITSFGLATQVAGDASKGAIVQATVLLSTVVVALVVALAAAIVVSAYATRRRSKRRSVSAKSRSPEESGALLEPSQPPAMVS